MKNSNDISWDRTSDHPVCSTAHNTKFIEFLNNGHIVYQQACLGNHTIMPSVLSTSTFLTECTERISFLFNWNLKKKSDGRKYSYKSVNQIMYSHVKELKKTGLEIFGSIIIILTWETERGLGNLARLQNVTICLNVEAETSL